MDALELETPALYIDLDVLERNIATMQARCRAWGVGLRPHVKTHKIREIAELQLAAGAIGITVAKISEAERLPGEDVLIAFPIMPEKLPRLRRLAEQRRVTVVADSVAAAGLLESVDALVEVDVGFARCGVQSADDFERVANACPRFRGLFYYPASLDEPTLRRGADLVRACLARRGGAIVCGGSTPTAEFTPLVPETTEVRFGSYVFNDCGMVALGVARDEDCALRVLVSVVSTAVRGQCVVDGGANTFALYPTRIVGGYGRCADRPLTIDRLHAEHGCVRIGDGAARVGEKLWVIPASASKTIALHDDVAYGRGGRVEGFWRVAARGCVR